MLTNNEQNPMPLKLELHKNRTFKHLEIEYSISGAAICFNQGRYLIECRRLTNSSEVLDFIFQINAKPWCSPEVLEEFVDALELLCKQHFDKSAQSTFCPNGQDRMVAW